MSSNLFYFCHLETNCDPAEWGAKVDDRFYNNHAFKVGPWNDIGSILLPVFQTGTTGLSPES